MAKDSSDSNEENEGKLPAHNCLHLNKAVQLPAVKKILTNDGFPRVCIKCKSVNKERLANGHVEKADEEDDDLLYICLRCGYCSCSEHAKAHSVNKQTEVHDIAVIPDKWIVRCFKCENELPSDASKQLLECVEFLRRRSSSCPTGKKEEAEPAATDENRLTMRYTGSFLLSPVLPQTPEGLPCVRGLANLGNTCFMNATLQCLAQTPFLLPVLEDMRNGGETFRLPGGDVRVGEETVTLNPLQGTLKEWGPLTAALAETLRELQSGLGDVYVPKRLRRILEDKCPQFAGYVQHDAHELMRQLLDTVRTEDLKVEDALLIYSVVTDWDGSSAAITTLWSAVGISVRYQAGILEELNLDKKSERNSISDRQLLIVKGYGRQAGDLLLKPCEVFRGELVSTLVCQRCRHATEHIENFLDLSLPVVADKPVHVRRRVNSEDRDVPSKHQLRRAATNARRRSHKSNKKFGYQAPSVEGGAGELPPGEEEAPAGACDASDEDSDAKDSEALDNKTDVGENFPPGPTRPELGPIIARYSPDVTEHGEQSNELYQSKEKPWFNESLDEEGQACGPKLELNRVEGGMYSSESPGGGSDVPNLGSDDNRINDLDNGGKAEANSNEGEEDSIDQEPEEAMGAVGGSGEIEIERQGEERADGDVGESGYSSEKPGNGNSACVSPSSALDICGLRVASEGDQTTSVAEVCAGGTMAPRVYASTGECTLITCLNQFTAQELLTGNNKVGCEACTERAHGKGGKTLYMDASKQLLVSNPPAILILHLKRFQVFGFTSRKNSEEVKFPTILDLAPFCSIKCKGTPSVRKDQSEVKYSLYGVVQHSGGMHGGHYVAYVKVRPGLSRDDPRWSFLPGGPPLADSIDGPPEPPFGKWYYVSDSNVQDVREPRVLNSEAYLLFYERIW